MRQRKQISTSYAKTSSGTDEWSCCTKDVNGLCINCPRVQQAALLDGATPPQLPGKNSYSSKLSSEHFGGCVLFGILPLLRVIC